MAKIIYVKNKFQKVLLEHEYLGQFSDGHWENMRGEHWRDWCNIQIEVSDTKLGRTFWAYDRYNLLNKDLLDVVGDRMIAMCNFVDGDVDEKLIWENLHETFFDGEMEKAFAGEDVDDYWFERAVLVEKHFGSMEKLREARKGRFDMTQLKKEIRELKEAMQTVYHSE